MKKDYSYINKSFVSIIMTFMLFSGIVYAEDTHEWKIDIKTTSLYNLSFMYSTSTKVPISVEIDDVKIENITFNATGTTTKQSTKVFRLLENGEHTVRLSEIGRGALPDIKSLKVEVAQKPVQLIIDTDMMTDPDDTGALAVAHALEDNGEAKILAVGLSAHDVGHSNSKTVSAINYYFNRNFSIQIGSWWQLVNAKRITAGMKPKFRYDNEHNHFHRIVASKHRNDGILNYNRRKTIDIYTNILKKAKPHSIVFAVLGTNFNIKHLMEKNINLFGEKVKEVVMSAPLTCNTNTCSQGGSIERHAAKEATDYMFKYMPKNVKLTVSGGTSITSYNNYEIDFRYAENSPMKTAYANKPGGYKSTYVDHLAVLTAVRGTSFYQDGMELNVDDNSHFNSTLLTNEHISWVPNGSYKNHRLIRFSSSDAMELKNIIGDLMIQRPKATHHYPTNIPTKIYKSDNYAWYVPIDYNMVY